MSALDRVLDFIKKEVYIDGSCIPEEGPLGCEISTFAINDATFVTISALFVYPFWNVFGRWYFRRKIRELQRKIGDGYFGKLAENTPTLEMRTFDEKSERVLAADVGFQVKVPGEDVPENMSMYFKKEFLPNGTFTWGVDKVCITE